MSAEREELLRLVEALPDEQVHGVLEDVRRHLAAPGGKQWPPAWFGSVQGTLADTPLTSRSSCWPRASVADA